MLDILTLPIVMPFWFYILIGIILFAGAIALNYVYKQRVKLLFEEKDKILEHQSEQLDHMCKKLEVSQEELLKLRQELNESITSLEKLDTTDPLVNVVNRRHFGTRLEEEWRRSIRTERTVSLVMIGIDYFRLFNENYGDMEGDTCLKQIADTIKSCASRPSDLVARFSGDIFVVLLPETDSEGAMVVATKIRKSIEALAIPHKFSPQDPFVTVSCGVATKVPSLNFPIGRFFKTVYQALETAKNDGRNCIRL